MATIREYFDNDARALTIHKSWMCGPRGAPSAVEIRAKIAYDFEANALRPMLPKWGIANVEKTLPTEMIRPEPTLNSLLNDTKASTPLT